MDCNRWSRHIHNETKYTLVFSLGWDKKEKERKENNDALKVTS